MKINTKYNSILHLLLYWALLSLAGVATHFAAAGRGVQPQEVVSESESVLKVNVDLVVLNFAVVDENWRSVTDLRQGDFTLYEDDVPQTITEFLPTEAPFNLALVLDASGSVRSKLNLIRKAGIEFAHQLRPDDRIGIIEFNSSVRQVLDFTSDRGVLRHTLDQFNASTFGGSKVYDAIAQAVYRLRSLSTGRNAIVILSDGMENASRVKFDGLRLLLAQSDAVLYPVTIVNKQRQQDELEAYIRSHPDSDPYVANARASLAVLSEIYQIQIERLVTLAHDSGGEIFIVSELADLAGEYSKIAHELRNTYSVAYYSTNPRRDGTLRTVRVEVKNPKYRIRTRSSYFVPREE